MAIKRRAFCQQFGSAIAILSCGYSLLPRVALGSDTGNGYVAHSDLEPSDVKEMLPSQLASCRSNQSGRQFFSLFSESGSIVHDVELPSRGHDVCISPDKHLVAVFARRPGDFVWIVDSVTGKVIYKIAATPGRHYYGHGVFSPDGHYLLCSENAFDSGVGCIGVYDARQGYQRVREFPSYGVGPHQIKWLQGQPILIIANGGIRTHPDTPRVKMNIETMQPNLSYVNYISGELLEQVRPPNDLHQLSIRHLDVAASGLVAIAMQYEGDPFDTPPLVALHRRGGPLTLLQAPIAVQKQMRNYCGSVTFSLEADHFAVSSPRGNLVTYWSAEGDYLTMHRQADACGVAAEGRGFLVSDGSGKLMRTRKSGTSQQLAIYRDTRWDNHLAVISG